MKSKHKYNFPFTAIVGQDDFKLVLILNLVDPLIGGVLVVGDKGTGKTTLIRGLANLMQQKRTFPFINLPIGATEDSVLGSIDLEQLINSKKEVVKQGLLNKADNGILYIDEINLLPDSLTDILLDAAASGKYHLEREGISKFFNSRFCLVGSMNPEEGDLRPQLKDRFGLSVNIKTPNEPSVRKSIIKRRLAFDHNPGEFYKSFKKEEKALSAKIIKARQKKEAVKTDEKIIEFCVDLALQHQVEGLRTDILLMRTAKAFAAFEGRKQVEFEDVKRIASFVLNHRSKKQPSSTSSENKTIHDQQPDLNKMMEDQASQQNHHYKILLPENEFARSSFTKKNDQIENSSLFKNKDGKVIEVDTRKTVGQYLASDKFEIKNQRKKQKSKEHHIFLIDSSGSMVKNQVVSYAKGAILKKASTANRRNNLFSIISLIDGGADICLKESPNIEELLGNTLQQIKTGGKTNMIAGLKLVKRISTDQEKIHHLNIITDGKINKGGNLDETVLAFQTLCKGIQNVEVLDTEQDAIKLGLARDFAQRIKANYQTLITENV